MIYGNISIDASCHHRLLLRLFADTGEQRRDHPPPITIYTAALVVGPINRQFNNEALVIDRQP